MARLQNTFEFIGALNFGKEVVKETVFDSGWAKKQASIIVNESQSNGVFVSLEGGYYKESGKPNKILTFGKNLFGQKGGKIEVAWEDRKVNSILDEVADFKKIIVDLTSEKEAKENYYKLRNEIYNLESKTENVTSEDEKKLKELYAKVRETVPHRYEFLHTLDAIELFSKLSDKLKGKKFRVKGEVQVSYWKEKFYTNYVPTLFELVPEETPNKLSAQLDLYFTKDAADKSLLEDKIISYNTYIYCYDSAHKGDKFFPFRTVLNGKSLDFNDPKVAARFNLIDKFMTVSGKNVFHVPFEVNVYRGSEIIEKTVDSLTEHQRFMVELGMVDADYFKEKGTMFGENISEVRLHIPIIKNLGDGNDFKNGAIETTFTEDELIYYPATNENSSTKPTNRPNENSVKTNRPSIQFDDLPF